jgi:ankyrin repeat protein
MSDALDQLVDAVQRGRADEIPRLVTAHPELRQRINDPHPKLSFDATPLLAAVYQKNRAVIEALLAAGADINVKSGWWAGGFGVLHGSDLDLAPFLIERGATVDGHAAARLGRLDVLEQLLDRDAAVVHARGGDGQTPLHFAATVPIAQLLLDRGADIDALDVDHESTPAQWMVGDRLDVARYLVEKGCRTDILMTAALGDLERTRTHLDADPSSVRVRVSERDFPKKNPRAGGTIYNWTLDGHKTPHAVARARGHEAIYQLLVERSPSTTRLVAACETGDEAALAALLAERPRLAAELDEDDRARLVYAAEANDLRTARLLLRAGWPLDVRGGYGGTALHWAAWHGNAAMVAELLSYRAALDVRDPNHDGTPLDWALHGSLNSWHRQGGDYAATIDALAAAGARVPSADDNFEASDAAREAVRRARSQ